ncbi:hypothetical protein GJ496_000379 [Pomphorhynchus laevis]|nr:hypothetical protein GJ496_000379 [Pomphorhynchus laevis]
MITLYPELLHCYLPIHNQHMVQSFPLEVCKLLDEQHFCCVGQLARIRVELFRKLPLDDPKDKNYMSCMQIFHKHLNKQYKTKLNCENQILQIDDKFSASVKRQEENSVYARLKQMCEWPDQSKIPIKDKSILVYLQSINMMIYRVNELIGVMSLESKIDTLVFLTETFTIVTEELKKLH